MAGRDSVSRAPQGNNEGGVNGFVIKTCIFAASGGLLFGYDLGISGGVTSMKDFLQQFFPSVYSKTKEPTTDDHVYCQYDNQILTLFTSSLYLAALVAASFALGITRVSGRKLSIRTGGIAFLIGAIINGIAKNVLMLIIGRLLLGVAIGFANQAIPVYLSEMAPANTRGALNISFQLTITVGVLVANLVNYGTAQMEDGWGWRVSLTLAAVPALFMMVGSVFLPETPNSLIERGHNGEAKKMLQKIRGINDVDGEFQDLIIASEAARKVEHPWMNILLRRYRPQLIICVLIPFFQQFTGMDVIMFYAPVLFKTLGFGDKASLISTAVSGLVNVLATFVTVFSVDKLGRRILFLQGGIQMIICQLAVGAMISLNFGVTGEGSLSEDNANLLLFLICAYVAAFAWSWGPLGWLLPSEICPLEVRPAGQAISVSVNMFFTFIIAQSFPSMLCHVKSGLFFFFTGFLILMTIFIFFFLPETKNVPIEEMSRVFRNHWFWGKYIPDVAINREPKDGVDV